MKFRAPILLAVILLSGCGTYEMRSRTMKNAYAAGNFELALAEAKKNVEQESLSSKEGLLARLEAGSVYRLGCQWKQSEQVFSEADGLYEQNLQKARVSVTGEAMALFTNPATLPYRGMYCDGIMLSTYQALNALQRGDAQDARTSIMRCYERQQEAVEDNAKRIEKQREAIARNQNRIAIQQTTSQERYTEKERVLRESLPDSTGYENYVNPFSTYLDGLFHAYQGVDASDRERARKSFERVVAFAPDNRAVQYDFIALSHAGSRMGEPCVYVIFETGIAPFRHQVRIDIPIVASRVSYVGVAFPALKTVENYVPYLTVTPPEGGGVRTERICNMDAVISQEFKNDLPVILTRAVASATAKAAAAYAFNRMADQSGNDWVRIGSYVSTMAYQFGSNIADTRSWTLLPKEFQVCRLPMPRSRRLLIAAAGCASNSFRIGKGKVVVVYVKSVSPQAPMVISQFALR